MKGNPYVGPRPYERSDRQNFYGREREARELQALITAEREVLVYAQSGAGKTSLFNARVIPALEEQGFHVLPVARVGADLPPEVSPAAVTNVFVFSALLTLAGEEADPAALLPQTLSTYLKTRLASAVAVGSNGAAASDPSPVPETGAGDELPAEMHPPVLIFDQFEELFTTHRDRWQEARGFFEQVRAALDQMSGLGVVFSMREEFLAALDPYLAYFPARLRARFRLELLGERGALAAITRPAETAGLPFAPGVAEKLVDDLRRTKVQGPNGEESVLGEVVEPVNLQVVCSQLWTSLPEDKTGPIQWEEVQQYGSVDAALSSFYDSAVLQAASVMRYGQYLPAAPLPPASQRRVREWVAGQLITRVNTRGLALRGETETAGLPNEAVESLEDLHMIRAEVRAGARWYELAHDRLIDPILKSNREWERKRETPLRVTARRWKETGDASLLYRGNALAELKEKVELQAEHPVIGFDMEEGEYAFYEASLAADVQFRKRRRQLLATFIGGLVLLLIMAALTILALTSRQLAADRLSQVESQRLTAVAAQSEAVRQQEEAMRQKNEADAQKAEVLRQKNNVEQQKVEAQRQAYQARAREVQSYASAALARGEPNLAALLAMQAIADYGLTGPQRFMAGEQVLRNSMAAINGRSVTTSLDSQMPNITSPDGRWLIGANQRNELLAWDLQNTTLAGDPAGLLIPGLPASPGRVLTKLPYKASAIKFSPSGRLLGVSDENGKLRIWDLSINGLNAVAGRPLVIDLGNPTQSSGDFEFGPDDRWLFTSRYGGALLRWDLQDDDPRSTSEVLIDRVSFFVISPDGRWMSVTANSDNGVDFYLWNITGPYYTWQKRLLVSSDRFIQPLFSDDSHWLIQTTASQVLIWDLSTGNLQASPLKWTVPGDPSQNGLNIQFYLLSQDHHWLAVVTNDRTVYLFDLAARPTVMSPVKVLKFALAGNFSRFSFSPDGCWLAYGNDQEETTLYWMDPDRPAEINYPLKGNNVSILQFSAPLSNVPDDRTRYLVGASNNEDHTLRLWDLSTLGKLDPDCRYRPEPADGSRPVPASLNPTIRLDAQVLSGLDNQVAAIRFIPGSNTPGSDDAGYYGLAARDYQDNYRLWDLQHPGSFSTPLIRQVTNHIKVVRISPDGRWLLAAASQTTSDQVSGAIYIWDLAAPSPQPVRSLTFEQYTEDFQISADSRWVLARDFNGLRLISLRDATVPDRTWQVEGGIGFEAFSLSADGRWMATSGGNIGAGVRLWPLDQPSAVPTSLNSSGPVSVAYVNHLVFSPDGHWLVGDVGPTEAYLWRLDGLQPGQARLDQALTLTQSGDFSDAQYVFDPLGRWLVVLRTPVNAQPGLLTVVDLSGAAPKESATFPTLLSHDNPSQLTLTPDGRWLLHHFVNEPGLEAWDANSLVGSSPPRSRLIFPIPAGFKSGLFDFYDLSDDAGWFVHRKDGLVEAWNVAGLAAADDPAAAAAQPDRRIRIGSTNSLNAVISPDGRWLITAQQPRLRLWDFTNPAAQPVDLLGNIPSAGFPKILFTPDKRLAYYFDDWDPFGAGIGRIYAFPLALDELERIACQQVGRSLADAEIQQYLQGNTPWPVCKP